MDERTALLGSLGHVETVPAYSRCDRIKRYLTSNRFLLYTCCFITSWGDRMWMFAIGVYMIALYPKSLQLTAIYGFVNSACSLLFGAVIGDLIDQSQRLAAVRVALIIRNLGIFSCSASVFVTFMLFEDLDGTIWMEVSKGVIIFLAIIAHLASMANQITVTKDWAVVVCGTDKDKLAEISAFFRRIDLVCKIVSPILVGQIMSFASNQASAVFICCENIVTLFIMYGILRVIYRRVPRLAVKEDPQSDEETIEPEEVEIREVTTCGRVVGRLCFSCISFGKGWTCFIRQRIAPACISLSMLFMTVLGFDNITVGYAYSQGMSPSALSWIMAASAVTGIIGTLLFKPLRRRFGLVKTGIIAFILDLSFLQMCVWSVFAPGTAFLKWPAVNQTDIIPSNTTEMPLFLDKSDYFLSASNGTSDNSAISNFFASINLSLFLLMTGIVTTRTGLWLIDLVVTQLTLETVIEKNRGKVNGVQYSLNMLLDLVKFFLVILVPQPAYFGYLIIASFSCIVIAFGIYLGFSGCMRCRDPPSVDEIKAANREKKRLIEGAEQDEIKTTYS